MNLLTLGLVGVVAARLKLRSSNSQREHTWPGFELRFSQLWAQGSTTDLSNIQPRTRKGDVKPPQYLYLHPKKLPLLIYPIIIFSAVRFQPTNLTCPIFFSTEMWMCGRVRGELVRWCKILFPMSISWLATKYPITNSSPTAEST